MLHAKINCFKFLLFFKNVKRDLLSSDSKVTIQLLFKKNDFTNLSGIFVCGSAARSFARICILVRADPRGSLSAVSLLTPR
jgi:hypothetical protein